MFLTKLAFKNLVRHRNRTLITALIIAFAIFFFILMDSLIGGMTEMSYENIIEYEASHLQVVSHEYREEEDELPLKNLLTVDEQLIGVVKRVAGYQASLAELNFQARLNDGINELPVIGKGVNPDKLLDVFELQDKFVEGSIFSSGEYKAVMGKRLADLLKLKQGDYITLLVKDKNETFNTIDVEISGLLHTGNPKVNSSIVYLPLNIAQQALNVDNQVSKLIVRLENKDLAEISGHLLAENLKTLDNNLEVILWGDLEAVSVAGAKQMGNQMILAIILLIAAIAIINTVILAALERMKEIGMMKAMGLQRKEIIYTFVLESTGIGMLGGLIGLLLGGIGVWIFSKYGIDWGAMIGMDMSAFGMPIIGKMYGVWNLGTFLLVFGFGVFVSLLSSILPAYWAASKDPVEAIYHQ
ncbi:FtsX-like permease family protein [Iocasia frigidifontis]|uniref:FtsX-like permease family protein n=1 Tax=Iocasia fonsfrigidae TaxID=2682810 RepID=A0A8A7KIV6_9FIRM|nr:FtsX-like permease family protein [Iocasia fonsfrigidae]QTL98074.1 FtsX-like permease family protein [Iocasia fonsfrigidae]